MSSLSRHLITKNKKAILPLQIWIKITQRYFNSSNYLELVKEIELEKSVLESNEYSDKVSEF